MTTLTSTGQFSEWPSIGDTYRSPNGDTVNIAAIWSGGVVFEGGQRIATAEELHNQYQPIEPSSTGHGGG